MFRFKEGDPITKMLPNGGAFIGKVLTGYRRLNGKIEYICETSDQMLFIVQEGSFVEQRPAGCIAQMRGRLYDSVRPIREETS